jgi:hypothetical protein
MLHLACLLCWGEVAYMHTHIHSYMDTYTRTHMRAYSNSLTHSLTHSLATHACNAYHTWIGGCAKIETVGDDLKRVQAAAGHSARVT